MEITITAVSRKERVSQKTGKPFTSLGLKCNEYGEKWLSGFNNQQTANWKVGDKVEVTVEQKGEYLNFSVPKPAPQDFSPSVAEIKNILNFTIVPLLQQIIAAQKGEEEYPEMDETNDAHDL